MNFVSHVKNFFQDEEGASAVEYAIIASLIAGVIAVAIGGDSGLGKVIANKLNDLAATIKGT